MYYRGDDFGANPEVVEQPPIEPSPVYAYANTPDSAIRAAELAAGRDVAASGFTGGGGFLQQAAGVLKTFGMFFAPFAPVLLPALASTPVIGSAIAASSAAQKLANTSEQFIGGALRPTTAVTTTAPEAITTAQGGTSGAASLVGLTPSQLQQLILSIQAGAGAPAPQSATPDLLSQARRAQAQQPSRPTRRSPRQSPAQRKALLQEALRLAQQ